MIVGLSAATLQGAPVVTQDIDLWFKDLSDPQLKKALDEVGAIYVPPFGNNPPMFAGNSTELFDIVLNMPGLESFEEEIKNSKEVSLDDIKVRVLNLDRIILSKKTLGRKKDELVLPVLEDALLVLKSKK